MKVLVTGGTGMVGSAFSRVNTQHEIVLVSSKDFDLRDRHQANIMMVHHSPDAVIHLAAKVGGVKGNTDYVAEYYLENILINTNVLDAAYQSGVDRVVSLLSTCVYPDKATYPLTEDQIHGGPPHQSNFGYAYAKRMLDVQSQAYRQQYGCNFITAIPNNLFGENDNYDLENSHVIPAITRKMYEAQQQRKNVALWGDGSPLREFTYSVDLVRALLLLLEGYNEPAPINIGNTMEVSIKSVAEKIAEKIGFEGEIVWQKEMPSGQYRKPSDNSKFQRDFKMEYTDFDGALTKTCKWFIMNYPKLRGVR